MTRPARKFYDAAEKMDETVFAVCRYLDDRDECQRCPARIEVVNYGPGKQGCRGLAEEIIAIVLEAVAGRSALARATEPK